MLIECTGPNPEHDEAKLFALLEEMELEGTVGTSEAQIQALWQVRERINEACAREGFVFKYDVSMPGLDHLYSLVAETRSALSDAELKGEDAVQAVVGYGHMGDGNVHLNVVTRYPSPAVERVLEPFIWEQVAKQTGSISAEHGLGLFKPGALKYSKSPEAIQLMHQLKDLFDPHHILNPYKVLPEAASSD